MDPKRDNRLSAHRPVGVHRRNFVVMVLYEVIQRTGWMFKNESIIVPSFINTLTGSPVVLGIFPTLSRLCRYPPQIFFARWLEPRPRKKPFFVLVLFLLALPWGVVSLLLRYGGGEMTPRGVLLVFIPLYAFFWVMMGTSQLASGTMRGKLFPPEIMGRLVGAAGLVNGMLALVIGLIINRAFSTGTVSPAVYSFFFGTAAVMFALNGFNALALREPVHADQEPRMPLAKFLRQVGPVLAGSADFRKLVMLVVLANVFTVFLMFYTSFALRVMNVEKWMLGYYFIAQNIATPLSAFTLGWLADRFGNRLVMRTLSFCLPLTPLCAAVVGGMSPPLDARAFVLVYFLVGMALPIFQFATNYLLETTPHRKHPTYLAVMNVVVFCFSPTALIVGSLIDASTYRAVFLVFAVLFVLGPVLCFRIGEPRKEART